MLDIADPQVQADAEKARLLAQFHPPRLRYCPLIPSARQLAFLWLDCYDAFYGGAAGGGKSIALLMAALQYSDVPGYGSLLLRRTYGELTMDGGLIEQSHDLLDSTDAYWRGDEHRWTFPSGAKLQFGHMQHRESHRRYQGFEGQFVGGDELTHFEEYQWDFVKKCLRRPAPSSRLQASADGLTLADVPLRRRAASNPGGRGHEWVKSLYVEPDTREPDAIYLPARIADNPYLDQASYIAGLSGMRGAVREQMLEGDWDVEDDGDFFTMDRIRWVDKAPPAVRRIRRWDLAATEVSVERRDPDWTIGLLMERSADGLFTVTDCEAFRYGPGRTQDILKRTARRDGRRVHQWFAQDPGQAGKDQLYNLAKALTGSIVKGRVETGDKADRAEGAAAALENGTLRFLASIPHKKLIETQLRRFSAEGSTGHDDVVDALSGGYTILQRGGGRTRVNHPRGRTSDTRGLTAVQR
jgi:predicted phage terminase large subunit-like protein